jgi:osmotically-inducible protein OsmY
MFHIGPRSFTPALIVGGLLGLTVAVEPTLAAPTRLEAQQSATDAELAAKIHKALTDDKALSSYGSTLKIVVSDGLVSLKGAVKSEADKKAVGQKVDEIAGAKNVMNNLFVSANDQAKAKPEKR